MTYKAKFNELCDDVIGLARQRGREREAELSEASSKRSRHPQRPEEDPSSDRSR